MDLFGINRYSLEKPITLFFSLLLEGFPFLLLGIVISSLLMVFVDGEKLRRWIPHHPILGAMVGSCLGLLLPVCEYGNVPVARGLLMQGIPAPTAIAFLVAAPTINPITISLTWVAFGDQPDLVLLRVLLSFVMATLIGIIFAPSSFQIAPLRSPTLPLVESQPMKVKRPLWEDQIPSPLLRFGHLFLAPPSLKDRGLLSLWGEEIVRELVELGSVFMVGSAIATLIQLWFSPINLLSGGEGFFTGILPLMLLGFVMSTGAITTAFFARHLTLLFNSSSLVAFLLFAPILDIKGLFLLCATFRLKAVLYLVILVIQLTFLLTLFLKVVLG